MNEYHEQFAIRGSDTSLKSFSAVDIGDHLTSSGSLDVLAQGFENGAKLFSVIAGLAAASSDPRAKAIEKAATVTAALATALAEGTKRLTAEAKAKEQRAAEARAFEKHIKDHTDRSMKDHVDRVGRGDYRDPPSAGRMADIGRMA